MNQIRVFIGLVVLGLVLAVSCGGDEKTGDGNGGGGTSPTGNTGPMCDKVSADEVSTALGIPGFEGPEVGDSYGTTTSLCEYQGPSSAYLAIYYYPSVSQSTFEHNREAVNENYPNYPAQDAPGIGDDAFAQSIPAGEMTVNSVFFIKGSTMVGITTGSTATLDQVKQLAVLVASKL